MHHVADGADHIDSIDHSNTFGGVWHTNGDTIALFDSVIFEGASSFFNFFDEIFVGDFVPVIDIGDIVWPFLGGLKHHVYHGTIRIFDASRNTVFFVIFQPRALC